MPGNAATADFLQKIMNAHIYAPPLKIKKNWDKRSDLRPGR
jgi:hypothetical protein